LVFAAGKLKLAYPSYPKLPQQAGRPGVSIAACHFMPGHNQARDTGTHPVNVPVASITACSTSSQPTPVWRRPAANRGRQSMVTSAYEFRIPCALRKLGVDVGAAPYVAMCWCSSTAWLIASRPASASEFTLSNRTSQQDPPPHPQGQGAGQLHCTARGHSAYHWAAPRRCCCWCCWPGSQQGPLQAGPGSAARIHPKGWPQSRSAAWCARQRRQGGLLPVPAVGPRQLSRGQLVGLTCSAMQATCSLAP